MNFTDEQAANVLFYLCTICVEAAENPEAHHLKDFYDFKKVQFVLFEAKCCNCSKNITGFDFTARLPMPTETMNRAYARWQSQGYCYFSGIRTTGINIGI